MGVDKGPSHANGTSEIRDRLEFNAPRRVFIDVYLAAISRVGFREARLRSTVPLLCHVSHAAPLDGKTYDIASGLPRKKPISVTWRHVIRASCSRHGYRRKSDCSR